MSDRDNAPESAAEQPNLTLTSDEKRVFGQLFLAADTGKLGVLTGELAVKFFEKSGLNPRILAEIWGIADTQNRGLLTKVGFSIALRLIGQAQAGQHPRPELALLPGPLPRFEGLNITYPTPVVPPTTSSPPPAHIAPAPPGPGIVRVPQLSDADCKKFTELFQNTGAVDGILPGDSAKSIFMKAKLSNQILGQIWNLADRQQKGSLTCPEFVVAMHLINCCKNGTLTALPSVLPPGLYEAACGRPPVRSAPERRPTARAGIPPPMAAAPQIPKQFSGGGSVRAQSPLSRQFTPPGSMNPAVSGPIPVQTSGDWAITPREKGEFDALFAQVDRGGKGYITGEEAVPFFSNSKLPEDILATIWDLADINKAGRLTADEFAIAMYLIRQQRSRRDGKGLPETLPRNLIPPSMRQPRPPAQPFFNPPPPAPPKSSNLEDLFSLDSFGSSSTPAATTVPATSPGFPPLSTTSMFALPTQKFVPQSEFGQMLAATGTGGSNSSASRPQPSLMEDLLGDNDAEATKIAPDAMELANLSNQISTLTKQTQEVKNKKAAQEQELSSYTSQKQDIEMRLAQIKSLYGKEVQEVKAIEERLTSSRVETTRLRQEYATIEATYNDLQSKRQEMSSQLEQDQREAQELKDRMRVINAENTQLKQQLEKLRLEAKQQKGFVTISKKQLATAEAERDKLKSEIDDARSAAAAAAAAASQITSSTPGSPTPSHASLPRKNPFMMMRSTPDAPYQSPFGTGNSTFSSGAGQTQQIVDDIFGPSFDSQQAGPPPPTTFGQSTQSGPSVLSASEGPFDHSTPPTSPPASSYHNSPQISDAPPPPTAASQITSAFLPLPISRTDSITSSVQVNPPASTHNSSRPDTPTNWVTGPAAAEPTETEAGSSPKNEERRASTSVRSDPGADTSRLQGFSRSEDNKSPFAPVTLAKSLTGPTTAEEEKKSQEKKDPFAFSSSAATISSFQTAFPPIKPEATGGSTRSNKSRASNMSRPEGSFAPRADPFGLGRDEKANLASKEVIDAAFASFGQKSHLQERQNTGNSGISSFSKEFPPIEELHQDDDESDSDTGGGFEDNFTPASPVQTRSMAPPTTSAPPEGIENLSKPGTPLSSANAQSPTLTSKPAPGADKNPFPQGLLSNDLPITTGAGFFPSPAGPSRSPPPPAQIDPFAAQSNTNNGIVDEFDDDAFRDLADAREVDGKGESDDFGVLAADTSFDEFNPVFDSPAQKDSNNAATKIASASDDDDFAKFELHLSNPAPTQSNQHTGASNSSNARRTSAPDWDAIFAGGDNKQSAAGSQEGGNSGTREVASVTGGTQNGTDPAGGNTGKLESDKEKLTKLTGMGFSRESSLKALEKFKFNLESATHYLLDN